jgi:crotonobetainyl-CoA:carnitine CoA-transferase CaiB-like acyl-CoA transferase
MRVRTEHKFEPELSLIRNALTFSETPIKTYRAPPLLGEHTQEVLGGKLGYDAGKIEELKKQGII